MHPRTGGRVIFELVSSDGRGATYRALLYTPDRLWRGQATVGAGDGDIRFSGWDAPDPPGWLQGYADAFLRSEWKARVRNPAAPWSGQIARWRAEPEE